MTSVVTGGRTGSAKVAYGRANRRSVKAADLARTQAERDDPTRYDPRYDGVDALAKLDLAGDSDRVPWRAIPLPWMLRSAAQVARDCCRHG
jgi:hypothetical protein